MTLRKPNRTLLILLIIFILCVFSVVFLKPAFLRKLTTGFDNGLPTKAQKQGYIIATNESKSFALEVPDNWKLINYPESEGYISLLTLQISDYKLSSSTGDAFNMVNTQLLSGSKLDISVLRSVEEYLGKPEGEITHQEDYKSNGLDGKYFIFKDPGFANAESYEVRLAKNGNVYYIKMITTSDNYKKGEELFKYILSTLVIK